jgi:hypothetical protein
VKPKQAAGRWTCLYAPMDESRLPTRIHRRRQFKLLRRRNGTCCRAHNILPSDNISSTTTTTITIKTTASNIYNRYRLYPLRRFQWRPWREVQWMSTTNKQLLAFSLWFCRLSGECQAIFAEWNKDYSKQDPTSVALPGPAVVVMNRRTIASFRYHSRVSHGSQHC